MNLDIAFLIFIAASFWVLGYDYRAQIRDSPPGEILKAMASSLNDLLDVNPSLDIQKLSLDLIKEHSRRNLK